MKYNALQSNRSCCASLPIQQIFRSASKKLEGKHIESDRRSLARHGLRIHEKNERRSSGNGPLWGYRRLLLVGGRLITRSPDGTTLGSQRRPPYRPAVPRCILVSFAFRARPLSNEPSGFVPTELSRRSRAHSSAHRDARILPSRPILFLIKLNKIKN